MPATTESKEAKERAKSLIAKAKQLNLKSVKASFSGSGDSGEINHLEFIDSKDKSIHRSNYDHTTGKYIKNKLIPSEMWDEAQQVMDDLIGKLSGDWWNNDGGFGEASIDFATCKAMVNASYQELRVADTEERSFHLPCYGRADV